MKKVILTTCLIATVLMNFTSGYTSNMTATADYETPIVVEGEYTSTLEDTIEETTTSIETAPTEVQITETQNTEFVETTSVETTEATETTTTEIQTTEPIETTVVEETTITSIAETTTTETTTTYIVGDADENGKLNVRDAAFIAKALANKEADTLPESADYTEDNKIDVRDAAAIARHLASRYNEEPVVTSVSNDISVSVTTTSTYVAHDRPTKECVCVTDENTVFCPNCGIPYDCTCGALPETHKLVTTTVSDVNTDDTTTTTAVGNDGVTTTQTAETINTLPVETTVALPTTTAATTTATIENATTSFINTSMVPIHTDILTTSITTGTIYIPYITGTLPISTTSTSATTTTTTTTTTHVHDYVTETETVRHAAEYQTKTVWMYSPSMYVMLGLNEYIPDGSNKYVPYTGEDDPDNWYKRVDDYDMLCAAYGDGSWDNIVAKYKDSVSSILPENASACTVEELEKNDSAAFFRCYIDKTNFTEYGITEEQWYDPDYMQSYSNETEYIIAPFDYYGHREKAKFNPELDTIVSVWGYRKSDAFYKLVLDEKVPADKWQTWAEWIEERYVPVAQETVLVNDAWTEIITHEVCECGHTK